MFVEIRPQAIALGQPCKDPRPCRLGTQKRHPSNGPNPLRSPKRPSQSATFCSHCGRHRAVLLLKLSNASAIADNKYSPTLRLQATTVTSGTSPTVQATVLAPRDAQTSRPDASGPNSVEFSNVAAPTAQDIAAGPYTGGTMTSPTWLYPHGRISFLPHLIPEQVLVQVLVIILLSDLATLLPSPTLSRP